MKKTMLITWLFLSVVFGMNLPASTNTKPTPSPLNPRENATVSFTFDGLMAICLGDPEKVSVGILNVEHHTPEVRITKIKDEQKTTVAILTRAQLRDTLYLDIESHSQSVSRYLTNSPANDPNDFRWTIDIESDLFQKALYIKDESLVGKIHFSAGLFYGRNLTDEKFRFFDNSGKALAFNRQIAEPGAKLNLTPGDALIIKSSKDSLRLVAELGVSYEIEINNLPAPSMASMDHWLYYYDAIGTKVTPYAPVMMAKAAFAPHPFMCAAAVFSKSKLN